MFVRVCVSNNVCSSSFNHVLIGSGIKGWNLHYEKIYNTSIFPDKGNIISCNEILLHLKEEFAYILYLYRVSQKKRNGAFSVHCELKVLFIFILLDRVSSAEENGT